MAPVHSFKYVYIPADVDEPLQQLELEIPEGKEVECLIEHLKLHFARTGMSDDVRAQRVKALMEQLGDKAGQVDPRMLDMAADTQMVENISLLANHRDVGYVGVNMYCDDHAQAKQLPPNPRATSLADCCGKAIQVRGDVFLARILDDDDRFERQDLLLSEVSSSAPWVAEARRQAAKRQEQPDATTVLQVAETAKARPPAAAAAAPQKSEAELAKERGNAAVKAGRWGDAVGDYTHALELQPGWTVAHSNRALVHLKLGQLDAAIRDCEAVLAAEPGNVKALLRLAAAREGQGQVESAVADYQSVLRIQPFNKEAAAALDRLQPPPAPPAAL